MTWELLIRNRHQRNYEQLSKVKDLTMHLANMAKIKVVLYSPICPRNVVGVWVTKRILSPMNDKFYKKFK